MAYNGWSYISFVAGEVKNPERNLLWSLVLGMTTVGLLYISANAAYLRVLTIPEIFTIGTRVADVATRTIGPWVVFVSAAVLVSILVALNGCILTAARLPFAPARDAFVLRQLGKRSSTLSDSLTAILWGGIWTAILVLSGSYETLYSYTIVAAWLFYTMTVVSVSVLRRKMPDATRPVPHVGLSVDSAAVRGSVGLVHPQRDRHAAASLVHGIRGCGKRCDCISVLVATGTGYRQRIGYGHDR